LVERSEGKSRLEDTKSKRSLQIGDWVEVLTKEEILRTLDAKGCLEGMPFMPEMFAFCGKKFQVYKIAHKTCDYSVYVNKTRRINRTVHLQTRCNGSAHDGCQAGCLLYWKEDWLKPSNDPSAQIPILIEKRSVGNRVPQPNAGCTEADVSAHVKLPQADDGSTIYLCQMTQVPHATAPLAWWDVRQYVEDYLSGNVSLSRIIRGFIYWVYYSISNLGIGVGRPMRWFYDKISPIWGGPDFPRKAGYIPEGQPTPQSDLNLQPGEWVRVKSHEEILRTVNVSNGNRGMYWDAELVPYCGGTYRVLSRVERIIGERTGKMLEMKSPCIILDSVVCQARYSSCRMFCPKAMYPYWREIWLDRISPVDAGKSAK
jgi:hypothetical protein